MVSVFGSIMSAIFGGQPVAATASSATQADIPSGSAQASSPASTAGVNQAVTSPAGIDVSEVLTAKAAQAGQALDWQHSIVDLMKLLSLDSSLAARKTLAAELHYTGDTNESAGMNVWLHKEVMRKLAENGGKVPDEFKT